MEKKKVHQGHGSFDFKVSQVPLCALGVSSEPVSQQCVYRGCDSSAYTTPTMDWSASVIHYLTFGELFCTYLCCEELFGGKLLNGNGKYKLCVE